jgi:hypothetical protein
MAICQFSPRFMNGVTPIAVRFSNDLSQIMISPF